MNQQPGSQPGSGTQPRPPKCYNCGADHYLMSCPEPVRDVPAGLAAAHAAKASGATDSLDPADKSQSGYEARPFKRQKTSSIATTYPPGPVITHYAPAQAQGFYGPPSVQPHRFPASAQPHMQQMPMQQNMMYSSYGSQPSSNILQGYVQPNMSMSSQGYGPINPNLPGPYMQPLSHGAPQNFGYQNGPGRTYYEGPMQQPYGYNSSVQYGTQQVFGQPPHGYPSYQVVQSFHRQPPLQGLLYSDPSPVQVPLSQSLPLQPNHQAQAWEQPPQGYHAYHPNHAQFGQPYPNHHINVPQRQPSYQGPQFGNSKTPIHGPSSSPVQQLVPQQGFGPSSILHQDPIPPNVRRSSSSLNFREGWKAAAPQASETEKSAVETGKSGGHLEQTTGDLETPMEMPEKLDEEARKTKEEFEWGLEHIFIEPKQHPADPIGYPLPVVYHEEPILPPAYDAEGIMCKYVRPTNLDVFARDIRSSLHWPSLKLDPVFSDIDFNAPPMQLEGFGAWLHERLRPSHLTVLKEPNSDHPTNNDCYQVLFDEQDDMEVQTVNWVPHDSVGTEREGKLHMSPPAVRNDRARTPSVNILTDSVARSSTPSFRVDDEAWAPQPGEGQLTTSPTEDPTETLLASLGVTGLPKPVQSNLSSFHSSGHRDESLPEILGRHPTRHDSGYASQRNSYSNGHISAIDNSATYGDYRQNYFENNPPPPPPLYMRRQVDGTLGSPSSDDSARCQNGSSTSVNDNSNQVANQASSPITPTIAETGTHDGTPFKERKNGTKAPCLRQEDDVTPKLKRRQPKVADAYSRRW